jgi:acylglycerol lipase
MQHQTGEFAGKRNLTIFTQQWQPDAPRGGVLLVHGYGEHSGRYAHVAEHLAAHGYAAFALDLRGHGRSAGRRVMVRRFGDFVADVATYAAQLRADHPDLPLFVYGHSMGSLVTLLFAAEHQPDLAGLITTGTALEVDGVGPLMERVLGGLARIVPTARLIPALAADAISRDPEVVEAYQNDPLVSSGNIRLRLGLELLEARRQCIDVLPALHLPYLALHGSDDLLTPPGAVEVLRAQYGGPELTVRVYDGLYHEVHNEPEHAQVLDTITTWLDEH